MLVHLCSICTMWPWEKEPLRKTLLANVFALLLLSQEEYISSRAVHNKISQTDALKRRGLLPYSPGGQKSPTQMLTKAGLCCGSKPDFAVAIFYPHHHTAFMFAYVPSELTCLGLAHPDDLI